jgi:glycine dehydrogenase
LTSNCFCGSSRKEAFVVHEYTAETNYPTHLSRTTDFLLHDVFNNHHSETSLMRYIKRLERKDLSLTHSMIAGFLCMKLNAAAEMLPLSMPGIPSTHLLH